MFRLKESSSGQLLNRVWGTSSESAHFWDPKIFTTVRERGYKWGWYYYNNNYISVHFHLMYLEHGSIICLMMTLWVETCRHIYNWQWISCVLTELILRTFKWKHIGMAPILKNVILTAFPLQRERVSILCLYVRCLLCISYVTAMD